jgi:excisionase family DNA binding protein
LTPLTLQAREVPPLHRTKRKGLKAHRNYTVEEVARLLGVARGTVRRSTKKGLRFVTERRPRLIRGDDLLDFLAKMKAPKARCQLHECYCFKCRAPWEPALRMADIVCDRPTSGNLCALCLVCETWMHKRVSFAALDRLRAKLDITVRQVGSSLKDWVPACLNDHSDQENPTMRMHHAKNELTKHKYAAFLEEAKRLSPSTVDQVMATIALPTSEKPARRSFA